MKRRFTLIVTAIMLMMTNFAWGQTRTQINWSAADQGYGNGDVIASVVFDDNVSAAFYKGSNNNAPKYYTTGSAIRCYGGNYFTITTTTGNLTEIAITFASGEGSNAITTDVGTYSNGTWTGSASSVTFTIGGTTGHRRVAAFAITYSSGGMQTVATPTFSPAAGTYYEAQNVTISCTTDGATIHYTTDGNDPTTSSPTYSTPIAISETTTVKAMAVKSGMNNSNIATATYTIEAAPTPITIAEAKALALNEYALVQGIVNFIDGKNVYVQDATAGICLYLNSAVTTLSLGDMVLAYGKRANYNGLYELSNINPNVATQFSVVSTGNQLPLAVKTIAEIMADSDNALQCTRVKVENATIGTINTNNNTPLTQGESTINIYKVPALSGITAGDAVDVISVIGSYNGPQLRVASASDVTIHETPVLTVATPTFTPEGGQYTEAQNVTIACTTEGATVYYTLDGTDPTANSAVYSTPIAISETTTVKAFAAKEGMNDSNIATAVYEIQQPTPPVQETAYTLITHNNALITGDKYIVVGIKGEAYKALGKQAANNRTAVDVTPVENVITLTPATTNEGGVFELTLGQADGKWTLYDAVNGGYLYAASSSANQLKVQAENDANGQWTIDIDANGVATIKAQGTNTRNWLRLNTSGSPFACYASGQLDVYLYKAGEVPTPPTPTYYNVTVAEGITNGTVTVDPTSALEGTTITVTADAASGYELTTLTYTYGTTTDNINLETMQFVMPASDVTVNATFTELATVAAPTFTPAAGTFITAQQVTLACATEDATIYYTLDGTDPTANSAVYSEAIPVSATTTVKAMAVKAGMNNSSIVSATYTIIEQMTIAAARALEANQYGLVQGVVTFIDGRNVYVQDETAGIDLYLNNNTVPSALAIGDMVLGYGKKAAYNGLVELTGINGGNANQFVIVSNDNPLPVAVKTIEEILADYAGDNMLQSTRVQIVEAVIGEINTSNNTTITQGESTLNIYKMPVVEGLLENDIVTVTGVIGCHNNPQLRVATADDVTYEHPIVPIVTGAPTNLEGFTYEYGHGPSTTKTFVMNGAHLTTAITVTPAADYEISLMGGDYFVAMNTINMTPSVSGIINNVTVYVRMKAGLEIGSYDETMTITSPEIPTVTISLSGVVTEPAVSSDYVRLTDLSQLSNGSKVVFAARFDENANQYYAMTAQASGKPTGVLFTSTTSDTGDETLPGTIADEDATYYWTVSVDNGFYTFTNANGDVLGYTSSTNFATGGDNIAWTITSQTSEATAMVPEYSAFVIGNANNAVRAIALNSQHNFGPYHTQNIAAENYNFFLDIFFTAGTGVLTCATPTFNPEGGTYFEAQNVEIACSTADATIHYTLDGTDPTADSPVYTTAIAVAENTTIKAIAMKEGYENSNIATAEYTIIIGAVTIINQDWEGEMNGWTFVTVEGSKPWTIASYSGNHYAYGNGYNGGANEQWCISPAFNINNYSNVSLSFRTAKNYSGPDLQLFFSNDYNGSTPATATWTELAFEKSTGSFAWVESGTIDLASFTGENCYIGFKYVSTETEAAAWEVDDINIMGFTSSPVLNVAPTALAGFNYVEGNGPSAEQSFVINGMNITESVIVTISGTNFEMSATSGDDFSAQTTITLTPENSAVNGTVYVRMAAGLNPDSYTGTITIDSQLDDITVELSGTVMEEGDSWNRIYSLSGLANGDQVILASRYDATVGDGYYAMPAVVSGKPDGVLFTSTNNGGVEQLPAEIANNAATYLWNVTLDGDVIILVNAAGDSLGYSSSTNFSGNVNAEWSIALETSDEGAMIPNYTGFVITNGTTTNRGIAKNASHKFGAYSTTNISSADYNFYLDLFVQGGSVTPTVATPVFSMASGTYYEPIEVEITCSTEDATIYYTLDGSDPTTASTVYTEAIMVDEDVTIKAFAVKEGYDDSNIATANYVIMSDVVIIFEQDWEGEMNGWSFVTVEGNKPWTVASYSNNHYAYGNGYNDDTDNEQWCISPAFNLNEYAGQNVVLTFMNAKNYSGPDLELFFSNDYDGQDPTVALWQPLTFNMSTGGYSWAESGEISLGAFTGSECYIGFKYTSTLDEGAAAWEVDDIMLVANMGTDPYLFATPNALSGFTHVIDNGPSEAQTFVLTGGNLPTGFLTLTVDNDFEISFDGLLYSNVSITIPVDDPTFEPTTIYVRLNGENEGSYQGTITIDVNNEVSTTVSLSGNVTSDGIGETLASSVAVWNNVNEMMVVYNGDSTLDMVVYNVAGQPVINQTIVNGSNVIRHDLAQGIYVVRFANSKEMKGVKVVVRR